MYFKASGQTFVFAGSTVAECYSICNSSAIADLKPPGSRTEQSEATENPNKQANKHLPPNRNIDLTIDRK